MKSVRRFPESAHASERRKCVCAGERQKSYERIFGYFSKKKLNSQKHVGRMERKDFVLLENVCQLKFEEAGECFHICTQENLPVVFHNSQELKAAMNAVAFNALLFPDVKVLTFEIMDNHLHFAVSGEADKVKEFSESVIHKLSSSPELRGSKDTILEMIPKIHSVESLENLRNVITYINRNGAVVNREENVFSYEWGANRYFFNKEAKLRYAENRRKAKQSEKRSMTRSHQLDRNNEVYLLDGYISPLCYCHISEAESFFSNSRQYFYKVSKNIEVQRDIAKIIGESIYYTDYDLIDVIASACKDKYGVKHSSELKPEQKLELAKMLHYDYNAGNKQIARLLKIAIETVSSLFSNYY